MMPLRKRLSRGLGAVLCLVFVVHWFAADWVIRTVAEKQIANRLADDGYSLMETLAAGEDDSVTFNGLRISSVYSRPLSGHYYQIKVDARVYPSPSLLDFPLQTMAMGPEQSRIYHLSGPEQRPLLVLGLGMVRYGHRINISVAEDLSAVDHDITAIRMAYFGLSLTILLCALLLLGWDIRRSLLPVISVGGELEQVSSGRRQRIDPDVPAEIVPLVLEINRLLELVVRRLRQSRTAIGNLAHALKRPVAILYSMTAESALQDHPELRRQLRVQSEIIHRCIERELKRARIAGDPHVATVFNPRTELFALKKILRSLYSEKPLDIQITAPDRRIRFDREDIMELAGNLLDNACKWARQRIDVELEYTDTLLIRIADDGPGCDEADAGSLIRRGKRLDESVQGHGLGLSIVWDIVNTYQGRLNVGRSKSLGGFLVTVELPLH
ncbi:sensor histidine kinase [Methylomonas sp. SURF-2]|uniref:histidine kinase n=1 Tax=Methylomonas subterranea TaxID=2952225 RepID=A0ABT1TEH7_9GAMM|nr:sensor histidine kinase [Methylomonas sp. SURF-2]MCQ8103866.1 sensor histidine kinase [Methylomonas sp. SURF-2]